MKKIAYLFIIFLCGCFNNDVNIKHIPGPDEFKPICLDGVQYFSRYYSGGYILTPRFNRESKVELCISQ